MVVCKGRDLVETSAVECVVCQVVVLTRVRWQ